MFYQNTTSEEHEYAEKKVSQRAFEQDQLISFHEELLLICMKLKHYFRSFDIFALLTKIWITTL